MATAIRQLRLAIAPQTRLTSAQPFLGSKKGFQSNASVQPSQPRNRSIMPRAEAPTKGFDELVKLGVRYGLNMAESAGMLVKDSINVAGEAIKDPAHAGETIQEAVKSPLGDITWGAEDMPNLQGKTVVVTGGTSGVGKAATKALAAKGATTVIASRNPEKGEAVVKEIKSELPNATIDFLELDLSSFASIRQFVRNFNEKYDNLHMLLNNASSFIGKPGKTEDGLQVTLGTNYFGHFFLTHLLLDKLKASQPARVVFQGSQLELSGKVQWDDLKGERATDDDVTEYGTAKLYELMCTRELNARLKGSGVEIFSSHPGLVKSPIFPKMDKSKATAQVFDAAQKVIGQSEERAALSILYAATSPTLEGKGGTYIGPAFLGPVPFNVGNTGERDPGNSEVGNPESCRKLYEHTLSIVKDIEQQLDA